MTNTTNELEGSPLPAHTITYVTTTSAALAALDRFSLASDPAADTETLVLRDENGLPLELDVVGPGPIRVLILAGRLGDTIESYVLDLGDGIAIDPEVAELYHVSGVTSIDRNALRARLAEMVLYGWNADFDERVLDEATLPARSWRDLMLAQASLLLGESGVKWYDSLATASQRYLGADVSGKGSIQLSYTLVDPLSLDQVLYAGIDGVTTCALVPEIMSRVQAAGLADTVEVEWLARPFRSRMERRGIYIDANGWRGLLAGHQRDVDDAEAELAALTGGGKTSLFDFNERPLWNPASPIDVKRILNEFAPDAVKRILGGRLFEKPDSVDAATLKLLDHPVADLLLTWRDHIKTLSTYGEDMLEFIRSDGRIHARYPQGLVSTGRLSSSKPNMQNLDPTLKHYFRPEHTLTKDDEGQWIADPDARVYVIGDLSQAELRQLAQLSDEPAFKTAFRDGEDMHSVAGAQMFKVNIEELKVSDPDRADVYRKRGKTMNFAMPYGLGYRSLAVRLNEAGVPTTDEEAKQLLALYLETYPRVAAWLAMRDGLIKGLTSNPPRCDFPRSVKLRRLRSTITAAKRALGDKDASARDIALQITGYDEITTQLTARLGREPHPEEISEDLNRRADMVTWAQSFRNAVILTEAGPPFSFESRTTLGRRRTFNVSVKQWLDSIIVSAMRAKRGSLVQIRTGFEAASGEKLTMADGSPLTRDVIKKRFEDVKLHEAFVSYIFKALGAETETICYRALADCIGGLGNAYRNAPIQGGVADGGLIAFGLLDERLSEFDDAFPVQTVHDSIAIECYAREASAIYRLLKGTMVEAMARLCPDVTIVADVDISTSLDTKHDKVPLDVIERLYANA